MTTNTKPAKSKKSAKSAKSTAKAKATKAKTKATAPSSATAQTAPALGLAEADLNSKETRVLAHLRTSGRAETASEIGRAVFARERPVSRQKSWARNALRRPVREGFVRQVGGAKAASGLRKPGEGRYKATRKGVAAKASAATEATPAVAAEE